MEAIGLAASLTTLISATGSAVKAFRALRDSPSEFERLRLQIQQIRLALKLQLQLIREQLSAHTSHGNVFITSDQQNEFRFALEDASKRLDHVERSLASLPERPGKVICGRWMMQHRTEISQLLMHLSYIEQASTSIFTTLSA